MTWFLFHPGGWVLAGVVLLVALVGWPDMAQKWKDR